MTQEEWLGDYFGTPFDELQSTIRAYNPSFSTSLGPVDESLYRSWKNQNAPGDTGDTYDYRGAYQAGVTPEQPPLSGHWTDRFKTPSHPTFSDESQYAGAYPERAGSWDGDTYMPPAPPQATPSELPSPPGSPESYSLPPAIRREIEHPFFVIGEKIRKIREDPFSSDSLGTYLDVLGAARVMEGGGIARSVPIPRRFYNPGKFITGEAQLGPAPAGAKPYVPAPPPGGYKFLEAFRNAVSKDDEVGAINVIRNATKEGVEIPFRLDEIFKARSPYVMREIDRHMLQTKGYSPMEGFFRPPPGYLEP